MILLIAAFFVVLGVILEALAHNGVGAPWIDRGAWISWVIAAILWFVTLIAGRG